MATGCLRSVFPKIQRKRSHCGWDCHLSQNPPLWITVYVLSRTCHCTLSIAYTLIFTFSSAEGANLIVPFTYFDKHRGLVWCSGAGTDAMGDVRKG